MISFKEDLSQGKNLIMPSSQFIINLIELKNSNHAKLSANLKKDFCDYGNLNRVFNELPRSLCSEQKISQLEKNYVDLYHETHFSKQKTLALYDAITLQAYEDLLDDQGNLHPQLIKCLNLDNAIKKLGTHTCRHAITYSYLEYINELLANKIDASLAEKKETGPESTHRSVLIFKTLQSAEKNGIDARLNKITFAKQLRQLSMSVHIEKDNLLNELSTLLSKIISMEFDESIPTYQQYISLCFWIDIMHLSFTLLDFNSFMTIYSIINDSKKNIQDIRDDTVLDKINECEKLANPDKNYQRLLQLTKTNIHDKKSVIPAYQHIKSQTKTLKKTENEALIKKIESLFSKEGIYKLHREAEIKKQDTEVIKSITELRTQLHLLKTFSPNPQKKPEKANPFSFTLSFFSTPFVRYNPFEKLYKQSQKDKPSYNMISTLADEASKLYKQPAQVDATLQKIQELSQALHQLGVDWTPLAEDSMAEIPVFGK